jgi:hypothetical protein
MDAKQHQWDWSLRVAVIAAATALLGLILWSIGPEIAAGSGYSEFRDDISAIGSALMSVASLCCILVVVLVCVAAFRRRRLRPLDGVLLVAALIELLVDATINAP